MTRFIVTQAGYLAWIGVACVLLSLLLERRTELASRLAADRSRLLSDALEAEQRERKALAEALHDNAIQNLLSARHELEEAGETIAHPALARADAALVAAAGQLREAVFDLHPYVLEAAGLEAALRSVSRETAARGRLRLRLDLHGPGRVRSRISSSSPPRASFSRTSCGTRTRPRWHVSLAERDGDARPRRRGRRTRVSGRSARGAARGRPHRPRGAARAGRGGRRAHGPALRPRRGDESRGAGSRARASRRLSRLACPIVRSEDWRRRQRDDHPRMLPAPKTTDGVGATIHVVAAQRVAQAAVTGFSFCEECGHPLTERQKVALLTAAILELDGLNDEVAGVVHVEQLIADLRGIDRS